MNVAVDELSLKVQQNQILALLGEDFTNDVISVLQPRIYACHMYMYMYIVHEQHTRQQTRQHNTTQHLRQLFFSKKKKLPQVGLEYTHDMCMYM